MGEPDEQSTLGPRGRELYETTRAVSLPVEQRALVLEAARLLDRLEKLDQLLRGDVDTWATIAVVDGGQAHLSIDSALNSARLHAQTLSQMLAQLKRLGVSGVQAVESPLEAARRRREQAQRDWGKSA